MSDDVEYHLLRAEVERVRASLTTDDVARKRHTELAELHRIASEVAAGD